MDINCIAAWCSIIGLIVTGITFWKVSNTKKELNNFRDKVLFNVRSKDILPKINEINDSFLKIIPTLDSSNIKNHINNLLIQFTSLQELIKNDIYIINTHHKLSQYLKAKYVIQTSPPQKILWFSIPNNEITEDDLRYLFFEIQRCVARIEDFKTNNNITQ